jgi:hypothetical protein
LHANFKSHFNRRNNCCASSSDETEIDQIGRIYFPATGLENGMNGCQSEAISRKAVSANPAFQTNCRPSAPPNFLAIRHIGESLSLERALTWFLKNRGSLLCDHSNGSGD